MKVDNSQQKGQMLLIIVMLMATAITVVLAIVFNVSVDTRMAKLEEESQKALAAAQGALEEAVRTKADVSAANFSDLNLGEGITGKASVVEETGTSFVTPLMKKDEAYTFYLADYFAETGTYGANRYNGTATLLYGTESADPDECNKASFEITILYGSGNNQIKRMIVDNSGAFNGANNDIFSGNNQEKLGDVTFHCATSAIDFSGTFTSPLIMYVRVLSADTPDYSTYIGLKGSGMLKSQGIRYESEANTSTGVTKKVQLFQSYPQIPADFFTTTL